MTRLRLAAPLCLLVLLVSGCGGGGGGSNGTAGSAVFVIHWPDRTRVVPYASNSVKIDISDASGLVATQTIPRPTGAGDSTVTFNLPAGDYVADAAAYPQADGQGVAQAKGTVPLTIQPNA